MTTAADNTGQTSRYTYDADGRRVRRTVGSSQEQWQVYGFDGELLAEYAASVAAAPPQKEYGYRDGQLLIVAEAGGGGSSSQNVTWTNAVGVSVAANNLTKTAGDDWSNARASSTQAINSGNGYVEFTASETTTHRMLGLGEFGSGYYTYTNIRYALYLAGSVLYTDEYGSLTNVGSYSTGDQLRVAVENGAVKYYKNGALLRTSSLAPTYPLYVNVAMYTTGSTLTGAVISDGSSSAGSIRWLVTDHLGTPRIILDQTGSLANVKRHDYLPFGEELFAGTGGRTVAHGYSADDGVRQQFTSKERDTETGLDYFEARYYSSVQGRFTSPDEFSGGPDEYYDFKDLAGENPTFYADLTDPQSLNKYQYAYNNPLLYIDPDGHQGVREWFRNAANKAADFADGVGRGISSSLTFGASGAPRSDDSLTNRAGQGVGTVVTAVAGYAVFNAGGGVTVLSGGSAAEVSVPVAVAGVVTVAGATVNAVKIAATPMQRNRTSDDRAGKDFTKKGKETVIEQNKAQNKGQTKCSNCGTKTIPGQQSRRGVRKPANETQVDHIIPKSRGGQGRPDNGRVLCRKCNLEKSNRMPEQE